MGGVTIVFASTVGQTERGLKQMLEFCEDGVIGFSVEYQCTDGDWHVAIVSLAVTAASAGQRHASASSKPAVDQLGGELFVLVIQVPFKKIPRIVLELFSQPWVSLITLDRGAGGRPSLKLLLDEQCGIYGLPGVGALRRRHCSLIALTDDVIERLTKALFGPGWRQRVVDETSWAVRDVDQAPVFTFTRACAFTVFDSNKWKFCWRNNCILPTGHVTGVHIFMMNKRPRMFLVAQHGQISCTCGETLVLLQEGKQWDMWWQYEPVWLPMSHICSQASWHNSHKCAARSTFVTKKKWHQNCRKLTENVMWTAGNDTWSQTLNNYIHIKQHSHFHMSLQQQTLVDNQRQHSKTKFFKEAVMVQQSGRSAQQRRRRANLCWYNGWLCKDISSDNVHPMSIFELLVDEVCVAWTETNFARNNICSKHLSRIILLSLVTFIAQHRLSQTRWPFTML